jgi:hypothetical protein
MSLVVVLTGGSPHAHDFDAIGAALATLLRTHGHDVERLDSPDDAADRLDRGGVDALVIDGLWWQMLDDVYEPWRAHAYVTPPSTRASIDGFVAGGGGLVALHTTPICFDDWPEWGDIVGGAWRWGVSSHPPLGPVNAAIIGDHRVVAGLPASIDLVDEVYGDLAVSAGVETLAVARRTPDDQDQPVVWTHRYGAGRVVFDGFGHDAASIVDHVHSRLIEQSVDWVVGADR